MSRRIVHPSFIGLFRILHRNTPDDWKQPEVNHRRMMVANPYDIFILHLLMVYCGVPSRRCNTITLCIWSRSRERSIINIGFECWMGNRVYNPYPCLPGFQKEARKSCKNFSDKTNLELMLCLIARKTEELLMRRFEWFGTRLASFVDVMS